MRYSDILKIAKTVAEDAVEYIENPCLDEKRGVLEYRKDRFHFSKTSAPSVSRKLVFVLESPHVDEFDSYLASRGPAQGKTGDRFEESIEDVCLLMQHRYGIFEEGSYDVWLVNAIQYQLSLGCATDKYRSVMFLIAWWSFGRDDFINRIGDLVFGDQDAIVANACTVGNTPAKKLFDRFLQAGGFSNELRSRVEAQSKKVDLSCLVCEALSVTNIPRPAIRVSHPYLWNKLVY